nr:hypothetical protein [Acetobacter persici]
MACPLTPLGREAAARVWGLANWGGHAKLRCLAISDRSSLKAVPQRVRARRGHGRLGRNTRSISTRRRCIRLSPVTYRCDSGSLRQTIGGMKLKQFPAGAAVEGRSTPEEWQVKPQSGFRGSPLLHNHHVGPKILFYCLAVPVAVRG